MSGALNHSPSKIMRQLLIDLGLGSDEGASWPVKYSQEPDTPDSVITVYDTTPKMQGRFMINGEVQENPGIQIRIRDANHDDGFAKANAIMIALDQSVRLTAVTVEDAVGTGITEYLIHNVSRASGVLPIGTETPTSRRHLFTLNVSVTLRQTT